MVGDARAPRSRECQGVSQLARYASAQTIGQGVDLAPIQDLRRALQARSSAGLAQLGQDGAAYSTFSFSSERACSSRRRCVPRSMPLVLAPAS